MRYGLLYLLLVFCSVSYGQKVFYVQDSITKESIENVNVNLGNGNYLLSDEEGRFIINDESIKEIELSHLGYKILKFFPDDKNSIVLMQPEAYIMEEVVLTDVEVHTKKIFPKVNVSNLLPHSYGTGTPLHKNELKATFIPNEDKIKDCYITKIILEPTGYNTIDLKNRESINYKEARYLPFAVNLYTVDSVIGIPVKPIFKKGITAQLKEGEKSVVIELNEEQKIPFPEEGIFIVVSASSNQMGNSHETDVSAPAFNSVGVNKKSLFKQYIYNSYEGIWKRDKWFWDHNSVYYFGLELEY